MDFENRQVKACQNVWLYVLAHENAQIVHSVYQLRQLVACLYHDARALPEVQSEFDWTIACLIGGATVLFVSLLQFVNIDSN